MDNVKESNLVQEIAQLRAQLRSKEAELASLRHSKQYKQEYGLDNEEILRYSRQLVLPEIAVQGQVRLKSSSVLIVGAGGLGCPAALYLASSGVGYIGVIDYDTVEMHNLHRQVLFSESDIGTPKVLAIMESIHRINSSIKVTPYEMQIDSKRAIEIIKDYDVVIDATDNVPTRYLLNDACVLSRKPLISASALKFEGHLSVFNYNNGPCYRCIFPTPPNPGTVTNCSEGGVFGPAVGALGVLQALEAMKIILGKPTSSGQLLYFDAMETKFRNIKLRPKNPRCEVCGENPSIKQLIDYEQFCSAKANDSHPNLRLLDIKDRISCKEFQEETKNSGNYLLIDVRPPHEYEICKLHNSLNIPIDDLEKQENIHMVKAEIQQLQKQENVAKVYTLCRRGNDSQRAVLILRNALGNDTFVEIKDLIGGLYAWNKDVDPSMPIY